jgi:hypothetical protein
VKRLFVVLWLSGCSAVAPLGDAGTQPDAGNVGDAGSPGDAGADAGALGDAGAPEPIFSASVLYSENFDSYADTSALKAGYPIVREAGGALSLDGGAMRIDYEPSTDGGCADAEVFVGKLVAGDLPEVIATWWFKLEPGFLYLQPASHCAGLGTGSTEWVMLRPNDPSGRVSVEVSEEPENPARNAPSGVSWRITIDDALPVAPRRVVYAQHLRLATHGPLALAQGVRHRVTLAVSRESGVGQADGAVQLWVDGALVTDIEDAVTGPAPFNALRYPTSLRSGAAQAQSRWLDEVVLFSR